MTGSCADFARELLDWYDRCRRKLPWRSTNIRPDPWPVLVSELMLQQTPVVTVIPYFQRFMRRFPTPADLAAAHQREVLRLWQGLGYYARARYLHGAACRIVADFQGRIPESVADLRRLPGVGRYTAGAVASIAYDLRAPILDGNVARVLCRLNKIRVAPQRCSTQLWLLAEEILPAQRAGDFNSALMDLGATICTARSPRCDICPVRRFCEAAAAGVQEQIPLPRKRIDTPLLRRWTLCVNRNGRWLLEQRPASGRWAGMWQFVTVEAGRRGKPDCAALGRRLAIRIRDLRPIGQVRQALTHRRYVFDVYTGVADGAQKSHSTRRWVKLSELDAYPLPRTHVRIAQILHSRGRKPAGDLPHSRGLAPAAVK